MKVIMFTDGAWAEGAGGWGVVMTFRNEKYFLLDVRELSGSCCEAGSNTMELIAAIEGFKAFRRRMSITVITDSDYLYSGMTRLLSRRLATGWKNPKGKPLENRDLWLLLYNHARQHDVQWGWVRSHLDTSGYQHRADQLAVLASRELAARLKVQAWQRLVKPL